MTLIDRNRELERSTSDSGTLRTSTPRGISSLLESQMYWRYSLKTDKNYGQTCSSSQLDESRESVRWSSNMTMKYDLIGGLSDWFKRIWEEDASISDHSKKAPWTAAVKSATLCSGGRERTRVLIDKAMIPRSLPVKKRRHLKNLAVTPVRMLKEKEKEGKALGEKVFSWVCWHKHLWGKYSGYVSFSRRLWWQHCFLLRRLPAHHGTRNSMKIELERSGLMNELI